ncbi:MAG: hypothetical protein M3R35_00035 [Candidatus Eremiobacteraeota bacterium]|nr:hypothetical protein [Candidatus Eremiobacteraeota bacterium]
MHFANITLQDTVFLDWMLDLHSLEDYTTDAWDVAAWTSAYPLYAKTLLRSS